MTLARTLLAIAILFTATSASQAAQRFVITVPGKPELTAKVIKTPAAMKVNNRGNLCKYVRKPAQDSANGRFKAFYCAKIDRLIRWPVSGKGPVLRHMNGAWKVTNMQLVRVQ